MRISARTFGQLVSNSTLVFANTGLALALFPFGAEANAAMAGGAGGIAGDSSEAGMELKRLCTTVVRTRHVPRLGARWRTRPRVPTKAPPRRSRE
jgi:hypothetical protein